MVSSFNYLSFCFRLLKKKRPDVYRDAFCVLCFSQFYTRLLLPIVLPPVIIIVVIIEELKIILLFVGVCYTLQRRIFFFIYANVCVEIFNFFFEGLQSWLRICFKIENLLKQAVPFIRFSQNLIAVLN